MRQKFNGELGKMQYKIFCNQQCNQQTDKNYYFSTNKILNPTSVHSLF